MRIHREAHGTGARTSWAHVHDDEVVVTLDQIELLPLERFLIERGEADNVLLFRSLYQQAAQEVFTAAVERATGRRVKAFTSMTSLDPPYAVEYFRLAPANGEPNLPDPASSGD